MLFAPNKKFQIAVALASLFAITTVNADATLHFKSGLGQNKETHNVIYIKDSHINLSQGQNNTGQNYSVFDAAGEKIIHINPQQKAYMIMDKATVTAQVAKMKKSIEMMRAQMEEKLKTMPPKQQQMMRKMMESQGLGPASQIPAKPAKKHVTTGKSDSIEGISCAIIEVYTDNIKSEELCVTKETKLGLSTKDAQAVVSMKKFMNYMAKSARNVMPNQATEEEFDGLPIRTRSYDKEGKLRNEIVLGSISKSAVKADKINIPAGYKQMDTAQMH